MESLTIEEIYHPERRGPLAMHRESGACENGGELTGFAQLQ